MRVRAYLACAFAFVAACGEDDPKEPEPTDIEVPSTYAFESRFEPGVSSVDYTGQTKRQLLIQTLTNYIGSLDDQSFAAPQPGDVVAAIELFYDFANQGGDAEDPIQVDPGSLPALQGKWGDLGALTTLQEKMAGVDNPFDGGVVGYADGTLSPEQAFFDMLEQLEGLIITRSGGAIPVDPSGADIPVAFVSGAGVDYQQLVQKYLMGAVALSQGADDYLDDDTPGKGLLSDNTASDDGEPYTPLEHHWDEGFGYFGAARDYRSYTDDEVAKAGGRDDWQGAHDSDGDGKIDFRSEFNFGHSTNASKRDRGAVVATDFSQQAIDAFLAGRTVIVNANGALSDAELSELAGHRDAAMLAWNSAVAATAVHYVNDVLQDMSAFETPDYDFLAHAKHWSELKGFALALQFDNRHSPLGASALVRMHALLGDGPRLPGDGPEAIQSYREGLLEVRGILGQAFGFAAENLGDMNGEGGW